MPTALSARFAKAGPLFCAARLPCVVLRGLEPKVGAWMKSSVLRCLIDLTLCPAGKSPYFCRS
jgi:hypothetical protein